MAKVKDLYVLGQWVYFCFHFFFLHSILRLLFIVVFAVFENLLLFYYHFDKAAIFWCVIGVGYLFFFSSSFLSLLCCAMLCEYMRACAVCTRAHCFGKCYIFLRLRVWKFQMISENKNKMFIRYGEFVVNLSDFGSTNKINGFLNFLEGKRKRFYCIMNIYLNFHVLFYSVCHWNTLRHLMCHLSPSILPDKLLWFLLFGYMFFDHPISNKFLSIKTKSMWQTSKSLLLLIQSKCFPRKRRVVVLHQQDSPVQMKCHWNSYNRVLSF